MPRALSIFHKYASILLSTLVNVTYIWCFKFNACFFFFFRKIEHWSRYNMQFRSGNNVWKSLTYEAYPPPSGCTRLFWDCTIRSGKRIDLRKGPPKIPSLSWLILCSKASLLCDRTRAFLRKKFSVCRQKKKYLSTFVRTRIAYFLVMKADLKAKYL